MNAELIAEAMEANENFAQMIENMETEELVKSIEVKVAEMVGATDALYIFRSGLFLSTLRAEIAKRA